MENQRINLTIREAIITALNIFLIKDDNAEITITKALKDTQNLWYEDDAIHHDMASTENREGVSQLKSNEYELVKNGIKLVLTKVDRRKGEKDTGADLIYQKADEKKYIIVQYKSLRKTENKIYTNKQLIKELERMMNFCPLRYDSKNCKQMIDSLINQQNELETFIKHLRIFGQCPGYLKIAEEPQDRNIGKATSGPIIPTCVAYAELTNSKNIPKNYSKSLNQDELENLFAKCLIGKSELRNSKESEIYSTDSKLYIKATETLFK